MTLTVCFLFCFVLCFDTTVYVHVVTVSLNANYHYIKTTGIKADWDKIKLDILIVWIYRYFPLNPTVTAAAVAYHIIISTSLFITNFKHIYML